MKEKVDSSDIYDATADTCGCCFPLHLQQKSSFPWVRFQLLFFFVFVLSITYWRQLSGDHDEKNRRRRSSEEAKEEIGSLSNSNSPAVWFRSNYNYTIVAASLAPSFIIWNWPSETSHVTRRRCMHVCMHARIDGGRADNSWYFVWWRVDCILPPSPMDAVQDVPTWVTLLYSSSNSSSSSMFYSH